MTDNGPAPNYETSTTEEKVFGSLVVPESKPRDVASENTATDTGNDPAPSYEPLIKQASPPVTTTPGQVALGSKAFFGYCGLGGALCCGSTHVAILPLDIIKCRMQIDSVKYPSVSATYRTTLANEGARGFAKGWFPTAVGYSMQGFGKFGFYEFFKVKYAKMVGEERAYEWRNALYITAAASAEFFADVALAPFEAAKVRIQTTTGPPRTFRECRPMIYREEGMRGFYKGLPPLWGRQVPYTVVKFVCFERTIEFLYSIHKPKESCSKPEQLFLTFLAGYIAGVACAVVSHPPDVIVSAMNKKEAAGKNFMQVGRELGWGRLWGGLVPRTFMIGTIAAAQWFIYDAFKVALNLPRPPPPSIPDSLKRKMERRKIPLFRVV